VAVQTRHGTATAMKRPLIAVTAAALMAGCAGTPAPPDWQSTAHLSLRNFEKAYLAGDKRAADAEFAQARRELSSTGRADLVAHAELTKCAVQVASIDFDDCPGFQALSSDVDPRSRAYADYLAGRWQAMDVNALPAWHRTVVSGGALPEDPLSRLVAAGAALRAGRITPAAISAASDTASSNGWRRPLLAWLGLQEKRALDAGHSEAAARFNRRINLVISGGTR
jgi:hypothetical protein